MSLRESIDTLFLGKGVDVKGFGFAGTLNIEGGFAEFRSDYFGRCQKCLDEALPVHNCKDCGRKTGNNVSFLAGRGDGVYSGISIYGDSGLTLLGAVYVFDENNAFSELVVQGLNEYEDGLNFQVLLAQGISDFLELEAFEAGRVQGKSLGPVFAGDMLAGRNDDFAVVDHMFSENQTYRVFLFMEPLLDSPVVATAISLGADPNSYTGGFNGSMRPRVAMLIQEEYADKVVKLSKTAKVFNWAIQCDSWNKGTVASNFGGNNNEVAMLVNARSWELTSGKQIHFDQKFEGIAYDLWAKYVSHEIGWNSQAALLGNVSAQDRLRELSSRLKALDQEGLISDDNLAEALHVRGWDFSETNRATLTQNLEHHNGDFGPKKSEKIGASPGSFCSNCGDKFSNDAANFCTSCGSKRS